MSVVIKALILISWKMTRQIKINLGSGKPSQSNMSTESLSFHNDVWNGKSSQSYIIALLF